VGVEKGEVKKCLIGLVVILFLGGCGTTPLTKTAVSREIKSASDRIKPERPERYGTVCVYRPKGFAGCGSNILIHCNFNVIGASVCGTYFCADVPSGQQTLWAEFIHRGTIDLNVKSGTTTYLLFDFSSDFLEGAYPYFKIVPEDIANSEIKSFKEVYYKPLR